MRIMFMGTPDIAMTVLARLVRDGHDVVAAVTREDKPRGRGNVMTPTPVKSFAMEKGIPVFTPKTLRDGEFMQILNEYKPELIAVVAYGKILPPEVLGFPKYGCVNLHVSLLPKYRGSAPMQRAVINGESETGVTVMYMDEGLDTGDIIAQEKFPITDCDDFETVHDRSAEVGGALFSRTLFEIERGTAKRVPQDSALATYAPKIEKEDCKIDFSKSATTVNRAIRGVTPIPGAFCFHNGKTVKISNTEVVDGADGNVGEVVELCGTGDGYFVVRCGAGSLKVKTLKPEGKGTMSAGDYIRGRKIALGDILE